MLFCHFICKYLLNTISEPLLQLRRKTRTAVSIQANRPNSQPERIRQEASGMWSGDQELGMLGEDPHGSRQRLDSQ